MEESTASVTAASSSASSDNSGIIVPRRNNNIPVSTTTTTSSSSSSQSVGGMYADRQHGGDLRSSRYDDERRDDNRDRKRRYSRSRSGDRRRRGDSRDRRGGDRDYRDRDRGGDRERDLRNGGGGSRGGGGPDLRPRPLPIGPRRFLRQGPSGWDVKPEGWVEGMPIPASASTSTPSTHSSSSSSSALVGMLAEGLLGNSSLVAAAASSASSSNSSSSSSLGAGNSAAFSAPPQQSRHARRLYVGGLENVSEQEVGSYFNQIIRDALDKPLPPGVNPVISVYINTERKFAFVELYSVEVTNSIIEAENILYKDGHPLKIRRPNDYRAELLPPYMVKKLEPSLRLEALPLARPHQQQQQQQSQGLGDGGAIGGYSASRGPGGVGSSSSSSSAAAAPLIPNAPGTRDSLNRIFVGNVPQTMNSDSLRELFQVFGALRTAELIKGTAPGTHKGYGFCEYEDPAITDTAVQHLNGIGIGGDRKLTVKRALPPGVSAATATTASSSSGGGGGGGGSYQQQQQHYQQQVHPTAPPQQQPQQQQQEQPQQPTRVVCLQNMLTVEELVDDAEYQDIVADITEECSRHGNLQLLIPRPPLPGAGRVFLFYTDLGAATRAVTDLHGRKFGPHIVSARYYDEASFMANKLDV